MKENFDNLGFEIGGMLHLNGQQALACIQKGALLVDVREDYEIAIRDFGIIGKLFCPSTEFEKLFITLPRDKKLIIADSVGIHSKEAVSKLLENGFTMVANLAGGIVDWERDGLPMSTDIESMSGQCPCTMRSRKKL
jgi:rhodanese-related sulfurtransferase